LVVFFLKNEAGILLKDDPLQVFAVHAGGGVVGMVLTGLLARYIKLVTSLVKV
jgi:Amt family ammonium transporter